MINITTAEKILKDYYLDVIREQFNTGINPFYAMIEKTSENVYGNTIKKVVATSNAPTIRTVFNEHEDIKPSGDLTYDVFELELKNLYGQIEISDKAIRVSENSEGSMVNLLNASMENLIERAKKDFGRMLFEGSTTKIGTITEVVSNGVYKLDNVDNVYVGDLVYAFRNIRDASPVGSIGLNVVGVDKSSKSLTLEYANGGETDNLVVGDIITTDYKESSKNMTGLRDIFDPDTNLYNIKINKSTKTWLEPVKTTLTESITIEDLQKMIDDIEEKSGDIPNIIICSWKARRKLQQLFSEKNIVCDTVTLDGGYKAMSYNGIPVVVDRYCEKDEIYFLNTEYFKLYQLCDWEWLADDKGSILRQVPNKAVFSATLVKYAELLCEKPCAQGRIVLAGVDVE